MASLFEDQHSRAVTTQNRSHSLDTVRACALSEDEG